MGAVLSALVQTLIGCFEIAGTWVILRGWCLVLPSDAIRCENVPGDFAGMCHLLAILALFSIVVYLSFALFWRDGKSSALRENGVGHRHEELVAQPIIIAALQEEENNGRPMAEEMESHEAVAHPVAVAMPRAVYYYDPDALDMSAIIAHDSPVIVHELQDWEALPHHDAPPSPPPLPQVLPPGVFPPIEPPVVVPALPAVVAPAPVVVIALPQQPQPQPQPPAAKRHRRKVGTREMAWLLKNNT